MVKTSQTKSLASSNNDLTLHMDRKYKRRVKQELEDLEVASAVVGTTQTKSLASSNNDLTVHMDREYKRRVKQELEDLEVASAAVGAASLASDSFSYCGGKASRSSQPYTVRCLCCYLIPFVVVGGIAAVLIYPFINKGGIPGVFPGLEEVAQEDPFNQTGPEEANRWRNNGNGLRLEVVNALDEEWFKFFYKAIGDWDAGTPDALSLTTSMRSPDPACVSLDGKLKVCNSDYGPTEWLGFSLVLIRNDIIFASTSKMNDFYHPDSNLAQKQYTMCHEVGHGFGLTHSDEQFYNQDRGECMDYTASPQNNDHPGPANFEFLAALYGTLTPSDTQSVQASSSVPGNRELDKEDDGALPNWLLSALEDVIPNIEGRIDGKEHEDGWRLLHRSRRAAAHEMDLGNGYTARVGKLIVPESH
jgi:hypothetical protein